MNFIISSTSLSKSLQQISGILSSNNTLPILDNFLFEFIDGKLIITSSDNMNRMSVTIEPDQVEGDGEVVISSKILLNLLKTFPEIPLTFKIDEVTLAIEMISPNGVYKLQGMPAENYPKKPEKEDVFEIMCPASILAQAVDQTFFATGNDELRPVITGVFCEIMQDYISFVATDAHKLVRYRNYAVKSQIPQSFIIPKKPLPYLSNVLVADDDSPVTIQVNQKNIFFEYDNISLSCLKVEGKYPTYEMVIPKLNPNVLVVDKMMLVNALRRITIFANKSSYFVKFRIHGQELYLFSQDVEFANEAKERLECNYEGADMEIGFNAKIFLETVQKMETKEVRIELSEPSRAGILLPIHEPDSVHNDDILMLVMPIMVA